MNEFDIKVSHCLNPAFVGSKIKNKIERKFARKIKNPDRKANGVIIKVGDYLLSHTPAHAVPSAYWVLTTLFGMGRGVSPRL